MTNDEQFPGYTPPDRVAQNGVWYERICNLCGFPKSRHRADEVAHHSECTLETFTSYEKIAELMAQVARLDAALSAVDDVLAVNWVGPRIDGDYRKAIADLVAGALGEHEYFAKDEHRAIAEALSLPPEASPDAIIAAVREAAKDRAQAMEALRQIQWGNVADVPGGNPYFLCPLCDQIEAHGHSPDCLVGMALADVSAEGEK